MLRSVVGSEMCIRGRGSSDEVEWHLTISNAARKAVNQQVNEHQAACYEAATGLPAILLEPPEKNKLQQEFRLFPALLLVATAPEDGVKLSLIHPSRCTPSA